MTTSTVGTTGRDYSTCKAWADACAADITATESWIGECYNDGTITETGGVALDSTQDATHQMILRCATGQGFASHADKLTNPLRPDQAKGVLVAITVHTAGGFQMYKYCRVEGIQITDSRGNYSIAWGAGTNTQSEMAVMYGVLAKSTSITTDGILDVGRLNLYNCALITTAQAARPVRSQSVSGRVSSCTLINTHGTPTSAAILSDSSNVIVVNTAALGWAASSVDNTPSASSSNNATDRASFGAGTSNQVSLTSWDGTDIYDGTASTEDLRAKSGGSLQSNGIRDQTYTNDLDIVGQSRSTTTPTIGCWEVVAGGAVAEGGGMLLGSRRNRLTIP